jgi:hypothetical protein
MKTENLATNHFVSRLLLKARALLVCIVSATMRDKKSKADPKRAPGIGTSV